MTPVYFEDSRRIEGGEEGEEGEKSTPFEWLWLCGGSLLNSEIKRIVIQN